MDEHGARLLAFLERFNSADAVVAYVLKKNPCIADSGNAAAVKAELKDWARTTHVPSAAVLVFIENAIKAVRHDPPPFLE
jgi:hypothetical protein